MDLRVCKFSLVSAASLSVGSYRCSRCQAPSCGEKRWEKRAGARERECHHPLSQIARVYIRLASFVFATSIAFPLSENLAQARIAGEGFLLFTENRKRL